MPTILASAIIGKARILLQDAGAVRYTDPELLGWLNDGQREIAVLTTSGGRPAYTRIANVSLVAGTKQSGPTDCVAMLDVMRNMGASGTTPGAALRKMNRRSMDAILPNWHSVAATAVVQHYDVDPGSPTTFYVYPPADGTSKLEVMYAALTADVAAVGNAITLDDQYANSLLEYLLFRAFSKDNEFIGNAEQAMFHRRTFETSIGLNPAA